MVRNRTRQLTVNRQAIRSTRFPAVVLLALLLTTGLALPAFAQLDPRNASVDRFDNGFTLIMLPEHRFPVVSTQMLYRVGARNEVSGKTGLAHFLEHMAFRDSDNFPGTDVVSRIYAIGGEWHGYTWTDQTTYYSTVPSEHVDLLLRIEADRMHRLKLAKKHMEAERGAVLAEMHMYENSPTSMLVDAVNYTSFLAHPYRNNTIGWESDIENLAHDDVVAFYEQHYHPANAVLAVVGDFDPKKVRRRVKELFGAGSSKRATPLPHTVEPPQNGLRRVTLRGAGDQRQFMIAYRAPSVSSPDFAIFLVLQEILGTGSGVSFLQNDWGTPVDDASLLSGAADSMTTWFPPSAQDYVFIIGGFAPGVDSESDVEQRIESRIASLRQKSPTSEALERAISDVQDALIFDIQTTEDAAHQLAFFDGLQALDTLMTLPEQVAAVSPADVQRVAARYLRPDKRSIAWHLPAQSSESESIDAPLPVTAVRADRPKGKPGSRPITAPIVGMLTGGVPVIVQHSDLSSTALIQVVLPTNRLQGAAPDLPVAGYSSIVHNLRPQAIGDAIRKAYESLATVQLFSESEAVYSNDPATRMEQAFSELMQAGADAPGSAIVPSLVVVVGDVDPDHVLDQLERSFGHLDAKKVTTAQRPVIDRESVRLSTNQPVAQAQLGYIATAPGPGDPRSDAWQLLLYILSHDYEGRLGKKAISDSGLAYYIGSEYRSDGTNAWVTLSTGVDSNKIVPLGELLSAELARLGSEPPTVAEINEAKSNRMGRFVSSAQSNTELAAQFARQWLWYGELLTTATLRERLDAISRQDIIDEIESFTGGKTIIVAE